MPGPGDEDIDSDIDNPPSPAPAVAVPVSNAAAAAAAAVGGVVVVGGGSGDDGDDINEGGGGSGGDIDDEPLLAQPLPGYGPYPVDGQPLLVVPAPPGKAAKVKRKVINPRRCGKCHKQNTRCARSGTATCEEKPCEGCVQCFYNEKTGKRELRKYKHKKKPKPGQ